MHLASTSPGRLATPPGTPDGYAPGACNIGPYELARRRRSAAVGLASTALLAVLLLASDAPQPLRLLVLFPRWGSLVAWLQVRRRFCVGFAMAGLRNLGADDTTRERVTDRAALDADRRTALVMIRDAFLLALPVAIAFTLLPR